MIVARNKIFNGNDFTIYWDDHVFFLLSFSLYLSVSLSSMDVILKMREEKKTYFPDGIKFPLGNAVVKISWYDRSWLEEGETTKKELNYSSFKMNRI